jgi:DNA helicase HerA-like ATPase
MGSPSPLVPESWVQIGTVLGTEIPVFADVEAMCEGHLAILGMTRMGKTSFAFQIAAALAIRYPVLILDQTGEYVGKRHVPPFKPGCEDRRGLSVFEPRPGEISADRALECLQWLVNKAGAEYRVGDPMKRVLILEEAHQFVPEPAGLGYGAPGRDSAYKFGLLMMQIRKYGLSTIMISQRTAVVAKSAISQCENLIAFKSVDQTGLDYLESLMGGEARTLLPTLQQGQAIAFGPAMSLDTPVVIDVISPGTIELRPALTDPVETSGLEDASFSGFS